MPTDRSDEERREALLSQVTALLSTMPKEETRALRMAELPREALHVLLRRCLAVEANQLGLAAHRAAQYFQSYIHYFGRTVPASPADDPKLSMVELAALGHGLRWLPNRDRNGRKILFFEHSHLHRLSPNELIRILFIMIDEEVRMSDSQDAQIVRLHYEDNQRYPVDHRILVELEEFFRITALVKVDMVHFISTQSERAKVVSSVLARLSSPEMRRKTHVHDASQGDFLSTLAPFGVLPFAGGATPRPQPPQPYCPPHPMMANRERLAIPSMRVHGHHQAAPHRGMIQPSLPRSAVVLQYNGQAEKRSKQAPTTTAYGTPVKFPQCLSHGRDENFLTAYQCLLRQQLEFFQATEEDTYIGSPFLNRATRVGQIGVRCIHCNDEELWNRKSGSSYFPGSLDCIYQSCQNIARNHLSLNCDRIPKETQEKLAELKKGRKRAPAGKRYWKEHATRLGVREDEKSAIIFARSPPT